MLSNTQRIRQHEKCACILELAIRAKNMANKHRADANMIRAGIGANPFNSLTACEQKYRWYMTVYERIKGYYSRQLQELIGEDYISVNTLATI